MSCAKGIATVSVNVMVLFDSFKGRVRVFSSAFWTEVSGNKVVAQIRESKSTTTATPTLPCIPGSIMDEAALICEVSSQGMSVGSGLMF